MPIYGGTYTNFSDRRLKKDIRPVTGGLAAIMRLRPVDFTWRSDGMLDSGFVAQDVKPVIPRAVRVLPGKQHYLGVSYNAVTATLVKAVQEQQAEIADLKHEVALLRKEAR